MEGQNSQFRGPEQRLKNACAALGWPGVPAMRHAVTTLPREWHRRNGQQEAICPQAGENMEMS